METKKLNLKWPHVGNAHVTEYLERLLANKHNDRAGQLTGTFIFNGPEDLGKTTVANYFAKFLLCQATDGADDCECESCKFFSDLEMGHEIAHGDCHIVKKDIEKKNISVETIRELINVLNMSSFLNSFKIGIIKDADTLSDKAANALLKTLEEPKKNVIIILITNDLDAIPLTIKSRAKVLNFWPVPVDTIYDHLLNNGKAKRDEAKIISRMSLGRPALAMKLFRDKDYYQKYLAQIELFLNFIDQDINERLEAVNNFIGTKKVDQDDTREAKKTLEIWEGVARDCFLYKYSNNFLIQNGEFETSIKKFSMQRTGADIVKLLKNIKIAKNYLIANVNFKTVIESVAVQV